MSRSLGKLSHPAIGHTSRKALLLSLPFDFSTSSGNDGGKPAQTTETVGNEKAEEVNRYMKPRQQPVGPREPWPVSHQQYLHVKPRQPVGPPDILQNRVFLFNPYGKFYFVDTTDGNVYWSRDTNTGIKICEYKSGNIDIDKRPYMKLVANDLTNLCLQYHHKNSDIQEVQIQHDILQNFLKGQANLDIKSTYIEFREPTSSPNIPNIDHFRITKHTYKISGGSWFENFPIYKGTSVMVLNSGQEHHLDITVLQTLTMKDFVRVSRNLKIRDFGNETLEDVELHELILSDERFVSTDNRLCPVKELYAGKYDGFDVAIELIKKEKNFYQIYRNLQLANNCMNVATFFGGAYDKEKDHYLMVFQKFPKTLIDYINKTFDPLDSSGWIPLMRNIVITFLDMNYRGICHGNIFPENIMMVSQIYVKISGLNCIKSHSKIWKNWDSYCFGRTVLNCFSKGVHRFDGEEYHQPVHDYIHDVSMIPEELSEVRSLVSRLIHPIASKRPSFEEVLMDIWIWEDEKLLRFVQDVSDSLGTKHGWRSRIERCYQFRGVDWKVGFCESIFKEMDDHRKNTTGHSYDTKSVCDLLLFLRNYMHHPEGVNPMNRTTFGTTSDIVASKIRKCFPGLFLAVFMTMKGLRSPQPPKLSEYF